MKTNQLKQADLMKVFTTLGVRVTPKAWDGVVDGEVVTTYGVTLAMESTGSTCVRIVRVGDAVDPEALAAEMRAELAARAKETRAAIRRERRVT